MPIDRQVLLCTIRSYGTIRKPRSGIALITFCDAMGALRVIPVDIVREEPLSPVRAVLPIRGGDADQDRGGSVYRFTVATVKAQDETQFHAQVRQDAIDQIGRMAASFVGSWVPGYRGATLGILGIL